MATDPTVWRLRVWLLGSFGLEVGGTEVPTSSWKSKKALNLFRYLATRRGEKVPKDVLNELLWPDTELDASTEQNLHTCVYFMRKIIDPELERYGKSELLTCSGGLYCFEDNDHCWVDTEEFEELYLKGKKLEQTSPLEAIEVLRQGLALYRGDLLMEEPYIDWATDPREYYREIYVDGALRAAALLAGVGRDVAEAIQVCRNALRKDPYREDLHHAVIGYLIDAGRHTEAATQYATYARMMKDEFGLEPSREAKALLQRIPQSGKEQLTSGYGVKTKTIGAYICEREFFESVLRLEYRRQARSRGPVTFMMVSVYGLPVDRQLVYSLASNLRQGDAICKWDDESVGICLWGTDQIGARIVSHRLKRELEKDGQTRTSISYDVIRAGGNGPLLDILQKAY